MAYEKISITVSGPSGSGKTHFINEVLIPALNNLDIKYGYFGKFIPLVKINRLVIIESDVIMNVDEENKPDTRNDWIGKWGFLSDHNPDCPDIGKISKLTSFEPNSEYPFETHGICYKYFRQATPSELVTHNIEAK